MFYGFVIGYGFCLPCQHDVESRVANQERPLGWGVFAASADDTKSRLQRTATASRRRNYDSPQNLVIVCRSGGVLGRSAEFATPIHAANRERSCETTSFGCC
ncbi:MAG: hypothetical protein CME04_25245 [Gemmatimonadaceae bacterium]|nr:hypothetical protein [Gemmatimonadaceae bacterium]